VEEERDPKGGLGLMFIAAGFGLFVILATVAALGLVLLR
jgi:hypothetical protein